jgi:mRNA interferase RelE/StbE
MRSHTVVYSKDATRTLVRLPRKQAHTIQAKIFRVAQDPYGNHPHATKLQGRDGYRLRVGDWRVIYEIVDARLIVHVVRIAARGNAYAQ